MLIHLTSEGVNPSSIIDKRREEKTRGNRDTKTDQDGRTESLTQGRNRMIGWIGVLIMEREDG